MTKCSLELARELLYERIRCAIRVLPIFVSAASKGGVCATEMLALVPARS